VADSDNDIETRVGILEREVAQLREQAALTSSDAAAARVLASGADHDVSEVRSELRAHTRALNALRETQLEQGEAITSIRKELAEHSRAITILDQKMSDGFATLHTGMAQIVTLLNGNPDAAQS
jgi:chromosome segregation ATPase